MGLLSAIAGYVDAAGFVSLLGLFPAHLTGEIVGFSIALSSGRPLRAHVMMIPIFVGAVAIAVVVARVFRRRGQAALVPLLAMMALALSLFTLVGFAAPALAKPAQPTPVLLASAVAAMGFQNAFMREVAGSGCPTTVMTGNLTQFVTELIDLFILRSWSSERLSASDRLKADVRLKLVGTALAGFTSGAGLGGWLTGLIGPRSMLIPTVIVFYLTLGAWREAN